MTKRLIMKMFPLLAVLLLSEWPVVYAQSYNDDIDEQDTTQIEVAEASVQPTWTVFGRAIGGVNTPGDLFYINATNNPADIPCTLYITNAQELINCYRYLILKVGVYVESSAGAWETASTGSGEVISDTFITLCDAQVSFTLPGFTKHKVTIDSGSFYCGSTNFDKGSVAPQFYLTVD